MPLLVKICGLSTPQALDVALDSGADFVGFVFFPPSPRHLALEAARALGSRVYGRAGKVALTVDANDEAFTAIIEALKPDMLQLHGIEPPGRVTELRKRFGQSRERGLGITPALSFTRPLRSSSAAPRRRSSATMPYPAIRPCRWRGSRLR